MPEEIISPVPTGPMPTEAKIWYLSTELWSAIIALAAFSAQGMGYLTIPVPSEIQASAVMVWMFILRAFKTSQPIAWTQSQLNRLA
jgi:hypothetical protein